MISDTELESGLRALRTRADDIAPPAHDLAQRTRDRYRAQRRSRATMAAGGLVAALVLVGVPVVASTLADPGDGEVTGPSGSTVVPAPPSGLYALPTRGSLADDEAWLDGVAALEWEPPEPDAWGTGLTVLDPAPDTRRVAFAEDVASGRVALVLAIADRQLAHAWFTGPEGAEPDEMELATLPGLGSPADGALSLLDATGPDAAELSLVVVTQPGDTVDLGLTPVVEADGTVRADRIDLDVVDGIASVEVDLPEPFWRVGGDVRARREDGSDRSMSMEESARLRGDAAPTQLPRVAAEDPRGLADRTDRETAEWSVGSTLASYGLGAEQARPTLLAAGQLGARVDQYGELYGMTHPSGATTTWLISYSPGNRSGGVTTMMFAAVPAGTPLLDQVLAVQAMAGVIVSAPAGTQAQVLDADGELLVTVPLERGAGTAPYNGGREAASVRILDDAGDVLSEAPVTGAAD